MGEFGKRQDPILYYECSPSGRSTSAFPIYLLELICPLKCSMAQLHVTIQREHVFLDELKSFVDELKPALHTLGIVPLPQFCADMDRHQTIELFICPMRCCQLDGLRDVKGVSGFLSRVAHILGSPGVKAPKQKFLAALPSLPPPAMLQFFPQQRHA
jgi:hypothetical protein